MNVISEQGDGINAKEGFSTVTIMTTSGEIVDRIAVPHSDGVLYCTDNPNTKEGKRYHKAIAKAKSLDEALRHENAYVWRSVKYIKPSKNGYFWFSDGVEVWAGTATTQAQVKQLTSQNHARFFLPIREEVPSVPSLLTSH